MKKITVLFAAVMSLFCAAPLKAQVYEPGNILIEGYYGWPNLFTAVVRSAYEDDVTYDYDVTIGSIGPLGGRAEYLITQRVGLGVNVNYANTSVKGKYDKEVYNSGTGNYDIYTYDYKGSVPRLRILPTISIHMGSSSDFDPYFAFGVGYSSMKIKEETNDPDYVSGSLDLKATPVAFRLELGMRYWVTDHIGLAGQFGLGGGPLLAAGLAAKF